MMGQTHATSAGLAFLAAAFPISHYVHHLTPLTAAVGTIVAAGAGMLPDTDHHSGTIANTFGPLTKALCRFVATISGGHRWVTHSLFGTAVFTGLASWATHNFWATTATVWLCMGLAVRALWGPPRRNKPNGRLDWRDVAGLTHALAAAVVAWAIVASGFDASALPWAVAVGYLAHLLGDSLTEQGLPVVLWPIRWRFRIATINTGGRVEKWVVGSALYAGIATVIVVTHNTWIPALLHTIGTS
jgi:membrane-bound metal-dependent hydrolase YbcI (DUF457 family)